MKKLSHFACLMAALSVSLWFTEVARAALVTYDFGTTLAPTNAASSVDPTLTATDFVKVVDGGSPTNPVVTDIGNPSPSAFMSYTEMDGASNTYFSFSVTASGSNTLNLSQLVFDAQRDHKTGSDNTSNSPAIVTIDVTTSAGGFGTILSTATLNAFGLWVTDLTTTLNMSNITALTFHILPGDGGYESNSLGFHLDNVELDGAVATGEEAVPEPTSLLAWAVLGPCGLGGVWFRRRFSRG